MEAYKDIIGQEINVGDYVTVNRGSTIIGRVKKVVKSSNSLNIKGHTMFKGYPMPWNCYVRKDLVKHQVFKLCTEQVEILLQNIPKLKEL